MDFGNWCISIERLDRLHGRAAAGHRGDGKARRLSSSFVLVYSVLPGGSPAPSVAGAVGVPEPQLHAVPS